MKLTNALPAGVQQADLTYPDVKSIDQKMDYDDRRFELWFVPSLGWCIPTLHIRNASSRAAYNDHAPRTYAVAVESKKIVRIGLGPHVKDRVTVYVRKSSRARLQPFIELKRTGAEQANTVRDRISSRRAQGALRRSLMGF